MKDKWWKEIVIYQIYPKSFKDSNGDGIGDICGIIDKLDYLATLGIGAIWLSPVCTSPQFDNGYDISDYMNIDSMFGNLDDMDRLIHEASDRNIKIILDLVLNHTSDEHKWFIEAKKSKNNPYHDYYVWRDGTPDSPPNDMKACFGGSAWEWVPELQQYYFHQFAVKQPDLNWNCAQMRNSLYNMINWWIDRGVGGFRLDVIDQIAKEPDRYITTNGPKLHQFIREMNKNCFKGKNLITVGEAWGADTERAILYSNNDDSEFSMVFQFEHILLDQQEGKEKWDLCPLDFIKLKRILAKWQEKLHGKGWNSLFWDNHDLPRIVSRWGNDGKYREVSAKMLATLLYGLQGTPYIYQGEELGMTNIDLRYDELRDIESINMYNERMANGVSKDSIMKSIHTKGRDNARTPMQWDTSPNAGFTTGTPWIKVNDNYTMINAKEQVDNSNSVFCYYQKLIKLRKTYSVFIQGDFQLLLKDDPDIFLYTRSENDEKIIVICNFHDKLINYERPIGYSQVLISNYDDYDCNHLRPYEAYILKL